MLHIASALNGYSIAATDGPIGRVSDTPLKIDRAYARRFNNYYADVLS